MIDYEKALNHRVTGLKPSGIRKFFDIAAEMDNVISLSIGEPDFHTPWHIREAGIKSLEKGRTRYTSNWGLDELRTEISAYLQRKFNLKYESKNEILVSVGGSEAIDNALRALVSPGDEVIIPEPSFVCYDPLTRLTGGVPVLIETKAEDEFRLTSAQLRNAITEKTKLVILPFPNNPTGGIMRREHLTEIAEILRDTNIMILSDEIYGELTYGGERHVSIAEIPGMRERTVVVGGFSKAYSMTGWRLGFACGPAPVMEQITKIHQYAIMCAPTTAQYAAVEALRHGDADIAEMRQEYDARRRLMVDGFRSLGLDCFEPGGAFYVFPCIKSTGLTSEEFCERLLYSQQVAVVPGSAFGQSGEGYIRVSYSNSLKNLKLALEKLKLFLGELKG